MKRTRGFNKETVQQQFFNLYAPLLENINFDLKRLYDCYEPGLTIVQHETTKVIAMKGNVKLALYHQERGDP